MVFTIEGDGMMTSKEFDLLMSLIIKMLEDGKVKEVIELLKKTQNEGN